MSAVVRPETSTTTSQRPERSVVPAAVRGAGAARFALPSGVRGMAGVGYSAHCAASGDTNAAKVITVVKIFIGPNTPAATIHPRTAAWPWRAAAGNVYVARTDFTRK